MNTVRMLLPAVRSSSSQVSTMKSLGPSAWRIGGRLAASHASPCAIPQLGSAVLWVLWQLFGTTNARLGSVPAARSAARSPYGRSFEWSTLLKDVQGQCLRV